MKAKRSAYSEFPEERVHRAGFYHPDPARPGTFNTRGGHFLNEDPKLFDHSFFGISPSETLTLDPLQRKILEVAYEAFESAGEPWHRFSGSRTGVFVGNFNYDHGHMMNRDLDMIPAYANTGSSASVLANRVNFVFNLQGPRSVDTVLVPSSIVAKILTLS